LVHFEIVLFAFRTGVGVAQLSLSRIKRDLQLHRPENKILAESRRLTELASSSEARQIHDQ
jgi:hypothetical protein